MPVFYDPMHPADAVLDRGRPREVAGLAVLAAGFGAVALGAAALVLHGDAVMEWLLARFPGGAEPAAAAFFGLVAAVTAAIAIADARTAARAARWPTVRGTIVSSVVESFVTKSGTASRGGATRVYQAVTEYAYVVDGREYHGSRECFGGSVAADEASAAARAARWVSGAPVDVRYDPANPTEAVLEVRVRLRWFGLAFAVLCGALALYFAGAFAAPT